MYVFISRITSALRDNSLFLIHGTADTKVNISQSWALTKALVQAEVLFKQMIYPNGSNSLASIKEHLHKTMENYFLKVTAIGFKKLDTGYNKEKEYLNFSLLNCLLISFKLFDFE